MRINISTIRHIDFSFRYISVSVAVSHRCCREAQEEKKLRGCSSLDVDAIFRNGKRGRF